MSDRFFKLEEGTWYSAKAYAEVKEENARLKAEVERLTKAGDALSDAMDHLAMFRTEDARFMARIASLAFKDARNAAKEGKGQP